MIWTSCERFGSVFSLFVANLILARLLSPEDFGAVAMLMVFISLSEAIVDTGFSSALIQRQDVTQRDYSTVFVWNICFGLFLYIVLFVSAPNIATFYNIPILKEILRVQGVIVVLNSLTLVQNAILKKQLHFSLLAKINLTAIVVGTVVGIVTAYIGFGVWSLVIKLVLTAFIQVLAYYIVVRFWQPSWEFDFQSLRSFFKFGGFIFLAGLVNNLYHNIISLVIGKAFNATSLGCYSQAKKLEDIPRSTISSVVCNVIFPVFSQINNDQQRLCNAAAQCMRNVSFISLPIMFLAITVAHPLFNILFTSRWEEAIPYFQILCLGGIALTPCEINANILNALGKSQMSFNVRFFQRLVGIALIFLGIYFGIYGLLMAYVISNFFAFFLSAWLSGRYIKYGVVRQVKDNAPFFIISLIALIIGSLPQYFLITANNLWMLILQTLMFIVVYLGLSSVLHLGELKTYLTIIKQHNTWKNTSHS